MGDGRPSDLIVRFNVGGKRYAIMKTTFPSDSVFYKYFVSRTKDTPFILDKDGAYFVDRDPDSFGIILNYFRLKKAKQMWETCLPKDPDRLALLTQEVLAKSASCPQGFDKILDHD